MRIENRLCMILGLAVLFLCAGVNEGLEAATSYATNFYDSATNDLGDSLWLAYTNAEDKTVYLKLPKGDRIFSSKVTIKGDWVNDTNTWNKDCTAFAANLAFGRAGIASADLDADGDLDTIIVSGAGGVQGYRNIGASNSPSWQADRNLVEGIDEVVGMGGKGGGCSLGDLDNDGDYDLLIAPYRGAFIAYRNTGTSTSLCWETDNTLITNLNGYTYQDSCKLVDLDGDEDLDLMIGAYDRGPAGRRNIGTSGVPKWEDYTNFTCNLTNLSMSYPALADLDGDGDSDLIMGLSDYKTRAWRNDGGDPVVWTEETNWVTNIYQNFYGNQAPALADLDADGDYDLICSGFCTLEAYRNTGSTNTPAWTSDYGLVPGMSQTAAGQKAQAPRPSFGDLDGDGDLDCLIFGQYKWVGAYKNMGSKTSPLFQYYPNFGTNISISYHGSGALGDLDNDGDLDLIAGDGDGIEAYRNKGDTNFPSWELYPSFLTGVSAPGDYCSPGLGDLDDDGDLDLIITGGNTNVGYENIGSKETPSWTNNPSFVLNVSGGRIWEAPSLGDLDNDGDLDLIIHAMNYCYRNTGTKSSPIWTEDNLSLRMYITYYGLSRVGLADLDNDGDLDAVGAEPVYGNGNSYGARNDSTRFYPTNFTMDVGADGPTEWGPYTWTNTTTVEVNDQNSSFSHGIQNYMDSQGSSEYILVPIRFHSVTKGKVFLSDLEIIHGAPKGTVIYFGFLRRLHDFGACFRRGVLCEL